MSVALVCTSCGHGLPNEPVFIASRSTTQHSPDGRVYTSLGAKTSMRTRGFDGCTSKGAWLSATPDREQPVQFCTTVA